jgi:hypothetical protein
VALLRVFLLIAVVAGWLVGSTAAEGIASDESLQQLTIRAISGVLDIDRILDDGGRVFFL